MKLEVLSGADAGKKAALGPKRFVIGREEDCDLTLSDDECSRHHAALEPLGDEEATIEDLGSRNGTFVDGKRITGEVALEGGEEIRIGQTKIGVEASPPIEPAAEQPAAGQPEPAAVAAGTPVTESAVRRMVSTATQRSRVATYIAGGLAIAAIAAAVLLATGTFSSEPKTVKDIVREAAPSTLFVGAFGPTGEGSGTAWVLDADQGLVVTNAHVVADGATFKVGFDTDHVNDATVVGVAPCDDIAVLKVADLTGLKTSDGRTPRTLPLADEGQVAQGEEVVALGYPRNIAHTHVLQTTSGTVAAKGVNIVRQGQTFPDLIATTAPIAPGNSGGPSVDSQPRLLGMNTLEFNPRFDADKTPGNTQNYMIGVDRIKELVKTLREGHGIGWGGFGFETTRLRLNGRQIQALKVTGVVDGTSASRAGLPLGSLVASVNGQSNISTFDEYCDAVKDVSPGDSVPVSTLSADGTLFDASIVYP